MPTKKKTAKPAKIKFDVLNCWTDEVQFTAEIDCNEDEPRAVKLGLAALWAIKSRVNLSDVDFTGADFSGVDFTNDDLCGTDFCGANFNGANFTNANFTGASLYAANFYGANFYGADLSGADLSGANFYSAVGNMLEIKSAQFDTWPITWIMPPDGDAVLQIGGERHKLSLWEKSDPHWIAEMNDAAAEWWARHRETVLALVKASPAVPHGKATP